MRVKIDGERCARTGYCVRVAPQLFALRDDGPTEVTQPEPPRDLQEPAREAAEICPALAIRISEDGGT